jgi:Cu-Zn family superoxide dismutase
MLNRIVLMAAVGMALIASKAVAVETGVANIKGTTEGSKVTGTAKFEDNKGGLKVTVKVENVAPGLHGFHVHEKGLCTNAGNDAGGHFNPEGHPHGHAPKQGPASVHPGDMGNINVGADGKGTLETTLPGVSLNSGKYNISGLAVILHDKPDDYSQPTGNAGGRIGCGVITVTDK